MQSIYKPAPKLVAKVKYQFKRKTDILRFFCLDGEQNALRHFAFALISV